MTSGNIQDALVSYYSHWGKNSARGEREESTE